MRIGLFTDAYLPDINGVVSSVATLKHALEELGHTVFVITNHKGSKIVEDEDGNAKTDGAVFHAVDEVHSEEGGNQGRQHHDDTDGRQGTHRGIHVVVDDAGIGVHRGFQNI